MTAVAVAEPPGQDEVQRLVRSEAGQELVEGGLRGRVQNLVSHEGSDPLVLAPRRIAHIMAGLDARFHAHDRTHPRSLPAPPSFLAETVGANLLLHVMFGRPLDEERIGQLLDLVAPAAP